MSREGKSNIPSEYQKLKNTTNYNCFDCNHCSCKTPNVRTTYDHQQYQNYLLFLKQQDDKKNI